MKKTMLALAASLLCFAAQPAMAAPACEKDCNKCSTECKTSLTYAKKKGAKYAAAAKAIQDCIKTCELCEDFEKRGSDLHAQASTLCLEACNKCIAACEATKDKELQKCIDECRTCATSCES